MSIFYAPDIAGDTYILNEEESRHAQKVLRLEVGDVVTLTDGKGHLMKARIASFTGKKCLLHVLETIAQAKNRSFHLHLAVAPTKNLNRFEWFLEKVTEIGVDSITPIISEHSERRVLKKERLQKIIVAAMKQSQQAFCPELNDLISVGDFLNFQFATDAQKLVAHCIDSAKTDISEVSHPHENWVILIGPEGDFSIKEVQMAQNAGFAPISLGSSRLRTETAAVVACHSVNILNR